MFVRLYGHDDGWQLCWKKAFCQFFLTDERTCQIPYSLSFASYIANIVTFSSGWMMHSPLVTCRKGPPNDVILCALQSRPQKFYGAYPWFVRLYIPLKNSYFHCWSSVFLKASPLPAFYHQTHTWSFENAVQGMTFPARREKYLSDAFLLLPLPVLCDLKAFRPFALHRLLSHSNQRRNVIFGVFVTFLTLHAPLFSELF